MSQVALHRGFTLGSVAPVATTGVRQSNALLNGPELDLRGKRMVEICKLMGDSNRLLIACLVHGEATHVTGMTDIMDESQPAVSHHLALFRRSGILGDQRDGRHRMYEFTPAGKKDLMKTSAALLGIEPLQVTEPVQQDAVQVTESPFEISDLHTQEGPTSIGVSIADTMKMLGDEMRLNILLRLSGKEMVVTDMCDDLERSQPAVSHHLAKMREEVKLLQKRRSGKHNFYSVNPVEGMSLLRSAARVLEFFAKGPQKTEQTKPE